MSHKNILLFLLSLLTILIILSSCEFILPKTIPLFIDLKDNYVWVSPNSTITLSFYTNSDINDCTIKINNDSITDSEVISVQSTSIELNGAMIRSREYTLNLSNYTKISTNDLSFDLYISVKRGNSILESKKRIFFGKLIKKNIVNQDDINSTYPVYQLYAPENLNNLSISSTVIVKDSNTIHINKWLEINGGNLIFDTPDSLTLEPSGTNWNGIKIANNGNLKYNGHLYLLNAKNAIYLTSSNQTYEFKNITINNAIGTSNTGFYNNSQSNITINNSYFHRCKSPIINEGSGKLTITDCSFDYQNGSIDIYGNTEMEKCNLLNLSPKSEAISSVSTVLTLSASPAISIAGNFKMKDCKISNFTIGLYIKSDLTNLEITENEFHGNTVSMFFNSNITDSPNISIERNLIIGKNTVLSTPASVSSLLSLKDCGIILKNCDGSIFYKNKIEDYSYGVAVFNDSPSQFFSYENIGNDIIDSNVYSKNSTSFANTYWGTTDATSIKKRLNPSENIIITPIATKSNY